MRDFAGKVAAITGAGSGIGRALAEELARRRAVLALCDVDEAGLADTVARCTDLGATVRARRVDVSDRHAVHAWADQVMAELGRVDLVVNNAGVALAADIQTVDYEDFEWLMSIDFWGVVYGTKAFLPHLKATGGGHVVNLSSIFGLIAIPSQSAYNAAKFAVRGFTEALRMELELDGGGVSCTTVHPGGVKTNIARRARVAPELRDVAGTEEGAKRFEQMALTTPAKAARQILAGVEQNRRRVLVGPDARVVDLLSRLPIGVHQRLVVAASRRMRRAGEHAGRAGRHRSTGDAPPMRG